MQINLHATHYANVVIDTDDGQVVHIRKATSASKIPSGFQPGSSGTFYLMKNLGGGQALVAKREPTGEFLHIEMWPNTMIGFAGMVVSVPLMLFLIGFLTIVQSTLFTLRTLRAKAELVALKRDLLANSSTRTFVPEVI